MKYVDANSIKTLGKICVFGTGIDADVMIRDTGIEDSILFFIDNNRNGHKYRNKPIISVDDYVKNGLDTIIVIASYRFANEIAKQLTERGIAFYIWDNECVFHYNNDIKKYIEFNQKIWGDKKISEAENEILVAFDNKHAVNSITHTAFFANHFAQKYKAKIVGYFRFGGKKEDISNVVLEVYKSINLQNVVDYNLTPQQEQEVNSIVEEKWNNINDWDDWLKIEVYGIKIGNTLIRHLVRHYIPEFEVKAAAHKIFLKEALSLFIFWHDYFKKHKVKTVLLLDGVCWESYIREIAIDKGIDVYTVGSYFQKAFKDFYRETSMFYMKDFWNSLSKEEQIKGVEWAKKELGKRIYGEIDRLPGTNDLNCFAAKEKKSNIKRTNKIKIVICPHIFEEDSYQYGDNLFSNNYIAWLDQLGRMSNENSEYEWYLKMHPSAARRDFLIIDSFLERYKNIIKLDRDISPFQMKKEGIEWALTVAGTISQEYPLIGIQVINAGQNVGQTFDFAWNPKTKDEYINLIKSIKELKPKDNQEEIYKFFATYFYYWDRRDYWESNIFFKDERLEWNREKLNRNGLTHGPWQYKEYMDEWSSDSQEKVEAKIAEIIKEMNEWKADCFYKKDRA